MYFVAFICHRWSWPVTLATVCSKIVVKRSVNKSGRMFNMAWIAARMQRWHDLPFGLSTFKQVTYMQLFRCTCTRCPVSDEVGFYHMLVCL
jgi:hypothetical protein